jgi:hypothetical protein
MSEYLTRSMGPGSIGGLISGAALRHSPTIGANAPRRNVRAVTHGASRIPSLSGCGCVGTENGNSVENGNGNGGMKSFLGMMLIPAAVIAGLWYFTR